MIYLFENPIPLLMIGLVLLTFSGVMYYSTRSVGSFLATVLIAVLTLCGLVMEQIVYTERELVEVAVTSICDAAENNDIEDVRAHLAASATETRKMVDKLMPIIQVEKANVISDIKIELDDPKNPKHATARFEGYFAGKYKKTGTPGAGRSSVTVSLVRGEHRWLIENVVSDPDFEQLINQLIN
ncbi:hypothetical protein [Aeoliella mucimassa]|uniref:Uncharacterized protein n=1 Tax=Aeoliella mucimassa TaxID=2527972 RepID=A0A518AKZ8_9BACT|nr:hypothetical protein [Aeoliella mucimassa]QDU55409.1 hypothetical protein Pan181_15980 [Aeoliella mucimassa]